MGGLRRKYTMLEFLFLMPFNVFVWTIKYIGSFLFWFGLLIWVYQSRSLLLDRLSDIYHDIVDRFRNRKRSTRQVTDDIDDYIV